METRFIISPVERYFSRFEIVLYKTDLDDCEDFNEFYSDENVMGVLEGEVLHVNDDFLELTDEDTYEPAHFLLFDMYSQDTANVHDLLSDFSDKIFGQVEKSDAFSPDHLSNVYIFTDMKFNEEKEGHELATILMKEASRHLSKDENSLIFVWGKNSKYTEHFKASKELNLQEIGEDISYLFTHASTQRLNDFTVQDELDRVSEILQKGNQPAP